MDVRRLPIFTAIEMKSVWTDAKHRWHINIITSAPCGTVGYLGQDAQATTDLSCLLNLIGKAPAAAIEGLIAASTAAKSGGQLLPAAFGGRSWRRVWALAITGREGGLPDQIERLTLSHPVAAKPRHLGEAVPNRDRFGRELDPSSLRYAATRIASTLEASVGRRGAGG
jgi:hypothetical protein